jgi:apolipoprotein N-acyltransferase
LVDGNEFAWVWPISVIGLPTLLAFFTGTYLAISRIISRPSTFHGTFTFALLLTFSEWARGHAFTGFPWNLFGYTWADTLSVAQGFAAFGAYGMTFLTVLSAAFIGYALNLPKNTPWKTRAACTAPFILIFASLHLWGNGRLDNNPTKFNTDAGVVVVQPNIAQTMKWDPEERERNFEKIVTLSQTARFGDDEPPRALFIVWPETAISPAIYMQTAHIDRMQKMLRSYPMESYLITGLLRRDDTKEPATYSNSIAFLNKDMTTLQLYHKFHLVPFGEFIPFQKYIPLSPVASYSGFERGDGATVISRAGVPPFSPLICYEIIFPDNVTQKDNAVRPQWIVNVTNDGWYGDSAGPRQHFAQTRLRAIEEGIPVIRSANTGISGVIDSYGRVVESADFNQEAAIVTYLPRPHERQHSPFWPWALQPLLFLASFGWMILGALWTKGRKI